MCSLILLLSNLQLGHGLDLIQGLEEGGILAHAAEVVAGDPDLFLLADLDHSLLADLGLFRHADLVQVL